MKIQFLEARVPLTKRFFINSDGTLGKDAYPLVLNFTNHPVEVSTPAEFHKAIVSHAKKGHCLIKGSLLRDLNNEPRKASTSTDAATEWICLDFDRHVCADMDAELNRMGLGEVSYVMQYSASHKMDPTQDGTISAHVFMMLDKPVPAPDLKAWLMSLNFTYILSDLELSRSKVVLHYPLDITTCQNDKLLYIAPPRFDNGISDPVEQRITLVTKKNPKLSTSVIGSTHMSALKTEERQHLNRLRKAQNLPARTAKTSWVGTVEVQNKPDACGVTGRKETGEYVRLNLNDGDSWAYWHHKDNFELIHDFKSDTWYKTKELLPGYYQELIEARQLLTATPTEDGDLILAFRDVRTAEYYNGTWNPSLKKLTLYRAKNETQLDHWMRSHGRVLGDFIQPWTITHDPRGDWQIDEDTHRINMFRMTPYMRLKPDTKRTQRDFPTIMALIKHMLNEGHGHELSDHFLNWFACIFQRKEKPITAWVIHGTEGTGKGYFMKQVVSPLLGADNIMEIGVQNVEDNFNGFLEGKLFVNVNEIDVDDFKEKGRVSAKFKMLITDTTMTIRRMRQTATSETNYASFLFSSNKKQPVYIPMEDRRYNVGNYQQRKLDPPSEEQVAEELQAFAEWLLAHQADIKAAGSIIQTEGRERIQKLGVTSIVETCMAITDGDFEALWMAMPDEDLMNSSGIVTQHTQNAQAYCMLMRRLLPEALNEPRNCLSRDEIQIILQYNVGNMPTTPNKFTSLLRHNGIETHQLRRHGRKTFGVNVEWKMSDELRSELELTFNQARKLRKIK